jgi:hypothetical protein
MKVFLFWLLAALPLGWGVLKSIEKSLPLFGAAPPAAAKPAVNESSSPAGLVSPAGTRLNPP